MKIISKYKDYYDYLVGIYGEDPLIILDRRNYQIPNFYGSKEPRKIRLYICDWNYEGLYINEKFYYGKAIEPFAMKSKLEGVWYRKYLKRNENKEEESYTIKDKNGDYVKDGSHAMVIQIKPVKTKVNTKVGIPILLRQEFVYNNPLEQIENFYTYPILKELNFKSCVPPEDMFLMLSSFMAKKDSQIDTRTNKEKIITAGFDLKESFRGKIPKE